MDFTKIFRQYKGLWVALSADEKKVLGKGKTVAEVVKQAERKGVKVPYLFKVPSEIVPYIGIGL